MLKDLRNQRWILDAPYFGTSRPCNAAFRLQADVHFLELCIAACDSKQPFVNDLLDPSLMQRKTRCNLSRGGVSVVAPIPPGAIKVNYCALL